MQWLPVELLAYIIQEMPNSSSFYNIALVCKRITKICQDPIIQHSLKLKFSTRHITLQNLLLTPGNERVCIRQFSTLPCGWKYGEDSVWNFRATLELTIKEDGSLRLQGLVDYSDKLPAGLRRWEDGKLVGEETTFHTNGKISIIHTYCDGFLEGEEQQRYDNGTPKETSFWHLGKLEGVQQGWYEDGTPSFVRLWRCGRQEGKEQEWNELGELTKNLIWPHNASGKVRDQLRTKKKKKYFPSLFKRRK